MNTVSGDLDLDSPYIDISRYSSRMSESLGWEWVLGRNGPRCEANWRVTSDDATPKFRCLFSIGRTCVLASSWSNLWFMTQRNYMGYHKLIWHTFKLDSLSISITKSISLVYHHRCSSGRRYLSSTWSWMILKVRTPQLFSLSDILDSQMDCQCSFSALLGDVWMRYFTHTNSKAHDYI